MKVEQITTQKRERTPIQKVLDKFGQRQTIVQDSIKALAAKGVIVSTSVMYQVVQGRSNKAEYIAAILDAAEAEAARRAELADRAAKLAA